MKISGAELVVKALQEEGVDTLFAYPGGQVIDLFHALYGAEGINLIIPRHEQGLIHAADGYARSTGKTGVCLVTSGPGATNLVTGIATANYDSVPLVCFTGQVATSLIGNDAFQEVDIVGITNGICKYGVTVRDRKDLGFLIKKAFVIARSGRPGVVVVDLPKDIQREYGSGGYPEQIRLRSGVRRMPESSGRIEKAWELLRSAQKPLILAGGGVSIARAGGDLEEFANRTGIPVAATMMGIGAIPTDHPLFVGNLGIHGSYAANLAVSSCDVLLSIGTRFNDRITGKDGTFAEHAAIIHVDIDPTSISKNIPADIPIVMDAKAAVRALLETAGQTAGPSDTGAWLGQIEGWKKEHPLCMKESAGWLTPQAVMEQINNVFEEAVIAADVGQNQLWAMHYLKLNGHRRLLSSGGLGTMGYGLPAALGAMLGNPGKNVIAICGDGGVQMNIQEMATAVAYELPVVICILNNGYLGNVRQWQELFYEKCYSGTCTRYRRSCPAVCSQPSRDCPEYTPDFVRLAESYGARGIRVTKQEDIKPALQEAEKSKKIPVVIEFIMERERNVMPIVAPGHPLSHMILEG